MGGPATRATPTARGRIPNRPRAGTARAASPPTTLHGKPRASRSPRRRTRNTLAETGKQAELPSRSSPGNRGSTTVAPSSWLASSDAGANQGRGQPLHKGGVPSHQRGRPCNHDHIEAVRHIQPACDLSDTAFRPVAHHRPLSEPLPYREAPSRHVQTVRDVADSQKGTANDSPLRVRSVELSPLTESPSSLQRSVLDYGQPLAATQATRLEHEPARPRAHALHEPVVPGSGNLVGLISALGRHGASPENTSDVRNDHNTIGHSKANCSINVCA